MTTTDQTPETLPAPASALLTFRLLQVAGDATISPADRAWSVMVEALWLLVGTTPRGSAIRVRLELAYDELTNRGGDRLESVRQARQHLVGWSDQVALVGCDLLEAYTLQASL